jgi:RNA polymerase sporulation-specific sigma factor
VESAFDEDKLTSDQTTLVSENIRFVHHIVKRYVKTGSRRDDMISAGYFGLIKASMTYKADKGIKFTTYAGVCINNCVKDLLAQDKKKRERLASLDREFVIRDNHSTVDYKRVTMLDTHDSGERIEDEFIQRSDIEERRLIVGLYLLNKSPRYAHIIKLRLQNKTHEAIAKEIGIGKSYISRILTRIERELIALKGKIDKTDGAYIKRYSDSDMKRAKTALTICNWIIQIIESPDHKNISDQQFSTSVNFLHKELSSDSDLAHLIDLDSKKLDIMFTQINDNSGVIVFKFRDSDTTYFLRKQAQSSGAYIESSLLTSWLFEYNIIPRKYNTCYYDEIERTLYVKVECATTEKI